MNSPSYRQHEREALPPPSVVALDDSRDRFIRASVCGRAPGGNLVARQLTDEIGHVLPGPAARTGIEVNVHPGDVTIIGGSQVGVFVNRTDRSVFGHGPHEQCLRSRRGILHLVSSCPALVVGSCVSNYRLNVPDDVPISVRAVHGNYHPRRATTARPT